MGMTTATATRLQYQHEVLYTLLEGQAAVSVRPAPDKWSLLENVAHLFAYQRQFSRRIDRILSEDQPSFEAYVGDNDPVFLEAREEPLADLLTDLCADRLYLHDRIVALDEAQLARQASHPRYGVRTLLAWTEFFLLHEAHHLFTMWKLLEEPQ
jgi:hypothetical protein